MLPRRDLQPQYLPRRRLLSHLALQEIASRRSLGQRRPVCSKFASLKVSKIQQTLVATGSLTTSCILTTLLSSSGQTFTAPDPLPPAIAQAQKADESKSDKSISGKARDSLKQRIGSWWLPYVVLEFDKNEVMIDALGGTIEKPAWHVSASL